MTRINCGIKPFYLSDQHLIAESVEITMVTGALRRDKFQIKGQVPERYCLGKGHVNFFKPKLLYLKERITQVNFEMKRRGFNSNTKIDLTEFADYDHLLFDWAPDQLDTDLVRERIVERLVTPLKAKTGFHRHYGKPIENINEFAQKLKESELFYV